MNREKKDKKDNGKIRKNVPLFKERLQIYFSLEYEYTQRSFHSGIVDDDEENDQCLK